MQRVNELQTQLRAALRILLGLYLIVFLLYLGAGIISALVPHIDLDSLFGDISDTADLPFYTGFLSQIDVLAWCASATLCWAGYIFFRQPQFRQPHVTRFLLWAAILTTVLMLDDAFLLHEEAFPDYLHIDEKMVLTGYMLLGMLFAFLNRVEIERSDYMLLFLALGLLAGSIFFDEIPRRYYEDNYLIEKLQKFLEDGSKTAGIFTWLVYFARYVSDQITCLAPVRSLPPAQRIG